MIRLALCFSSKERVDLSKRSIEPLLGLPNVDVHWIDGSTTEEGQQLPCHVQLAAGENHHIYHHPNVRGGADAAIVFALTLGLAGHDYTHIALCENDVLLRPGWLEPTLALFERGRSDGLEVGAVSTRCYQDRILCQRDGYALMHNLGAGHIILTREAARLILDHFRTTHTLENRKLFAQLSGKDIGTWWAFGAGEHFLTADWGFDKILASHGLASLALTPSPCQMLDQDPALVGLKIVTEPFEVLRDDKAFALYRDRTALIRSGEWTPGYQGPLHVDPTGTTTFFPHQLPAIGATYEGDWRLKWQQGFGPFVWQASEDCGMSQFISNAFSNSLTEDHALVCTRPAISIPVLGPAHLLVGGGKTGGQIAVSDEGTGYQIKPDLPPDNDGQNVLSIDIPAGCVYRNITVTALSPGVNFYGLRTRDPQPWLSDVKFNHEDLPRP